MTEFQQLYVVILAVSLISIFSIRAALFFWQGENIEGKYIFGGVSAISFLVFVAKMVALIKSGPFGGWTSVLILGIWFFLAAGMYFKKLSKYCAPQDIGSDFKKVSILAFVTSFFLLGITSLIVFSC